MLRSRLCRTVALTVFVSILIIEAIVLVPSYLRYETDLLDRLEDAGMTAAIAAFGPRAHASDRDLMLTGRLLNRSPHFRGGTLFRADGTTIGSFGVAPDLTPTDDAFRRERSADGANLDVLWTPDATGLPFAVAARLDAAWIGTELTAFVWRIAGLVLILSLGVAAATVLILSQKVLRPILQLRQGLLAARRDTAHAGRYALTYPKADEIGDIVTSFNDLLKQVSTAHIDELRAREQRFRHFADAASDFYWEMDQDLRFSYFSSRMSEIAGVSAKQMLGRTREETGNPGVAADYWQRHLDDLKAHRPFRGFEHPRTKPDGTRVYLSINGKPVFDANGVFLGYRGTGTDITDRVLMAQALADGESRFRDFAAASSDWFWEMDADLRFTYISAEIERVAGLPAEWHYGKRREEVGIPDVSAETWTEHLAALEARQPFKDFAYRRRGSKGDVWMRISGVPIFDENGTFKGYRGTGSDLTEQYKAQQRAELAQQRLSTAVEGLVDIFVLWSPDDRLLICNQRYRDINAEVPEATRPGVSYEDYIRAVLAAGLVPEAGGREETWLQQRLLRHRYPEGPFEMSRRGDQWFLIREQRMADGSTVTIGTDITERKRMEQELQRATFEAERANSAKSEFLAGMSHELRTPLNAIIGFSEMIRDEIAGPVGVEAYKGYAADIHASGQHLLGIVSDLLDLAKIEAGKLDLNEEVVDVDDLTRDCLRLMQPRAEAAKLTMALADISGPIQLWADSRLLRQILLNLLSNAVKFTSEGGRIEVSLQRTADGDVALSVRDDGIGIDPASIERVLSPFEQAELSADIAAEGTGLGLSVSKALAELHGGSLTLDSTPGQGTTAVVRLPAGRLRAYAKAG